MTVRLDSAGIAAILKSPEMQAMTREAAERIAGAVEAQGKLVGAFKGKEHIDLPVKVLTSTSDRARATVVLAHPAGAAMQAKHGVITKAVIAAGLQVKGGGR